MTLVAGGVLLGVLFGGRGLCSWALSEKLNASIIINVGRNLFMLESLQSFDFIAGQIITHEFARMTQNPKHL
jgi:hypothetical protein